MRLQWGRPVLIVVPLADRRHSRTGKATTLAGYSFWNDTDPTQASRTPCVTDVGIVGRLLAGAVVPTAVAGSLPD